MAAMAAVTTTTELKKPVRVSMAGIGHVDEREVEYMTETVCDDTSKPIRAAAEKEAGVESIQVDPHKTTDTFDYHGNFDSKRFELWFEKLCKLAFFECAGRDFNEKDEQRYENGLTTFDWTATPSETYDMCPSLANAGEEGDCDVNEYGCLFQLDGAKYHRRVTNPSPTKSAKRTYMVDWLQANHPTAITPDQVQTGGLTRPKLWEIIKPRKPKKEFAMYKISRKYGHDIIFTPSYNPRSAPIEIIWANIKNPISAQATESFAHLKEQVWEQHANITEKTWLGAYRTSRAWEDEMFVQDKAYVRDENENDESDDLTILPCDYGDAIEVATSDEEDEEDDDGMDDQ